MSTTEYGTTYTTTWNEHGVWDVWIQLEAGDPSAQDESFVIGMGITQLDALIEAWANLMNMADSMKRKIKELETK